MTPKLLGPIVRPVTPRKRGALVSGPTQRRRCSSNAGEAPQHVGDEAESPHGQTQRADGLTTLS
jgi:hypothetical protein